MQNGLKYSGIPLGGLGTGSVEIQTDGYFHDWQIMNNIPLATGKEFNETPDCGYFGLHLSGDISCSLTLGTAPRFYSENNTNPAWNNPYFQPWMIYADEIIAEAKFPFTKLKYIYNDLDLEVELEAFTPFIPHDYKNSGLPTAFFNFSLINRGNRNIQATLFGAFRNLSSYDNPEAFSEMEVEEKEELSILTMKREGEDKNRTSYGEMAIAVKTDSAGESSWSLHPRMRDLWEPLRESGRLDKVDMGDFAGKVGNEGEKRFLRLKQGVPYGALGNTVKLIPNEKTEILINLSWYFPSHYERDYKQKGKTGRLIGHQYNNHFTSASQVADYALNNFKDLRFETKQFFDAYYDSSQPDWLLEAASAQLAVLVKSSWWDEKGRFIIWEGLGCCGQQTTDITYYGSFPILQLFPEIQKSQMRCTLSVIETPGKIPHMIPGNYQCCDVDHRQRKDLIPQFILLIWRDYLWTRDKEYLKEMWQTIKDALIYFDSYDSDGDGLPNNTGPDQTYDQLPLFGTSAFLGYLYTASLIATKELAEILGETEYRNEIDKRLGDALPKMDQQLWNGKYYDLSYDVTSDKRDDGVMADQVNGDWFLRQTVGKGMLPDEKVISSLESVMKYCRKPEGYLANCAWPDGKGILIDRKTADQANWPWTGVEYTVASHLIIAGLEEEGITITKEVWDRYEKRGMRFNHIECGGFYYRALSSWCVYLALTGFSANLEEDMIELAYKENTNFVYMLPDGWGIAKAENGKIILDQKVGEISFSKLRLKGLNRTIDFEEQVVLTKEKPFEVIISEV